MPLTKLSTRAASAALGLAGLLLLLPTRAPAQDPSTAPKAEAVPVLEQYVRAADPAFAWSVTSVDRSPLGTVHQLAFTSQVWHDIPWKHQLRVFEPVELKYPDTVLLFVTGGSSSSKYNPVTDGATGYTLAKLCGTRVAVLPQVPNQPLLGDKTEDALIAETFLRFLKTDDPTWPLLFPMVKSAVRAMDAVQQWAEKEGKPPVRGFVVTGASKRGWTTWLTAASRDPRVKGIAPMVIDTLNMKAQKLHALDVWGKPSEQINDYTENGLTEQFDTPNGRKLIGSVDPFAYRDRLTLPKLLINGTNDRYWTLDAMNIYWDELAGPKSVVYVPNAGHDLAVNRTYATHGIAAFVRHLAAGTPWPTPTWAHGDGPGNSLSLVVDSKEIPPTSAKLWVATSPTRDFREVTWEARTMALDGGVARGETARPASGFVALLGDLSYERDGLTFHLSTQVRQTDAAPAAAKGE